MLTSEMILFALLAINALTFSQIEGWTYLEGAFSEETMSPLSPLLMIASPLAIYFSVVALLSIGFGGAWLMLACLIDLALNLFICLFQTLSRHTLRPRSCYFPLS
jgi:hypothetical protein